jgi:SAM-dependent methyltransferase
VVTRWARLLIVGLYVDHVLPRITDVALRGADLDEVRARVCSDLAGEVLEVGFGSGLNVPHYPAAVERVRAVDPATVGRKLAADRLSRSTTRVEFVGLDGERLPLEDDSVDHVLTTWTLCTIPDVGLALREMRRVLRPGGLLHFVEHGLAPEPKVARWQERLNPIQRRLFGGCHLDRPIDRLIEASGLRVDRLDNYYAAGLKPMTYFYEGRAIKA